MCKKSEEQTFWAQKTGHKTYTLNFLVVLVGNKCDMDEERVVSYERGRQLADQLGKVFGYLENFVDFSR